MKKDQLIDLTFSEVLDKMVEEFLYQYAFKYSTLDYTGAYKMPGYIDFVEKFSTEYSWKISKI